MNLEPLSASSRIRLSGCDAWTERNSDTLFVPPHLPVGKRIVLEEEKPAEQLGIYHDESGIYRLVIFHVERTGLSLCGRHIALSDTI